MAELTPIGQLIADHINACADHERMFRLNDYDLAEDAAVDAACQQIDAALLALCRARPTTLKDQLRFEYLSPRLVEATDGSRGLIKTVFDALLGVDEWEDGVND